MRLLLWPLQSPSVTLPDLPASSSPALSQRNLSSFETQHPCPPGDSKIQPRQTCPSSSCYQTVAPLHLPLPPMTKYWRRRRRRQSRRRWTEMFPPQNHHLLSSLSSIIHNSPHLTGCRFLRNRHSSRHSHMSFPRNGYVATALWYISLIWIASADFGSYSYCRLLLVPFFDLEANSLESRLPTGPPMMFT